MSNNSEKKDILKRFEFSAFPLMVELTDLISTSLKALRFY